MDEDDLNSTKNRPLSNNASMIQLGPDEELKEDKPRKRMKSKKVYNDEEHYDDDYDSDSTNHNVKE